MKHRIEFYFDFNSPYSYIASLQIEALCARHGAELEWLPIVLGGVFSAIGTNALINRPAQAKYMFQDMQQLTAMYGLPYKPRTQFLFKPVLSLRAAIQLPQGPQRTQAVHALFRGAFAEDLDLGDAQVVTRLLDQAGLDGKALVEGANQQPVKDALKEATDRAIARGVFGAPTMFLDGGRMFWGHDRLQVLEHYLKAAG